MVARTAARRAALLRAVAVLVAVGAVAVTLGPAGWRPDPTGDATFDRLLGGLVAGVAVALAWPRRRLAIVGLVAAIVGLEAAQRLAPGRDPAAADAVVKVAGALAGVAAVRLGGRGTRLSPARATGTATLVAALLAALAWWLLAPPAAVRRVVATRAWPADEAASCHPPGPPPTIDVWDRTADRFAATLRGERTRCILAFARDGLAWRLTAIHVPPPR